MTGTPIYSIQHRDTGQWVEFVGFNGSCILAAKPHEAKRWCWPCVMIVLQSINERGEFVGRVNPPPRNDGYVYTCECRE